MKVELSRRYPNSSTLGRHSTPVEVILRMLVVKRLYDWSFEATERNVSDSLVLRQFTRLYLEPVPDDTTLIRWAALIGPETLLRLNDRTVDLARTLRVTRGRRLRTDGTVVETNIHHPTDSSLLSDSVKVVKQAVLPKPGRVSPERRVHERQGWFRRGMRWQAGAEGRIRVMKQRGYLGRCWDKRKDGFYRWVGWGVLTSNLSSIARTVATR